jgi:CubicO group peptidase (beta-lactamase class C family)
MDSMKLFWCAALAATALSAQTFSGAAALDEVINQAIEQGRMPGAVLLVGHEGKVVYRKAYGKRALVPRPEAMTLDTVFDCASLTKVVATTSSLMKLFEEGRFRLGDKITGQEREARDITVVFIQNSECGAFVSRGFVRM